MSRLPIFEGGLPNEAARRSNPVQIPGTALTETPNAPGLAVPPPVSEGALLAAQLGAVLGQTGQVADAVRIDNARAQAEEERAAARQRAEDEFARQNAEAVRAAQIGEGARIGAVQLKDVLVGINSGNTPRDNTKTAAVQAQEIVAGLVKGMPEDQAEGYRRVATDNIAEAFANQDAKRIAEARNATLESAENAAVLAKSPEELQAAYKTALTTKIDPVKAASTTYLAALQVAAERGEPLQFDMIAKAMPAGLFASERAKAKLALDQQVRIRQDDVYKKAADEVGSELYRVEKGEFGASFQNARNAIEAYRPLMSGDHADLLLQRVASREAEASRDLLKLYDEEDKSALTNDHVRLLDAAGDAGVLFGVQPLDATTRKGTPVKMTREEGVEVATRRAFDRINAEEADPIKRLRRQADWAAKNGVQPGDWDRLLAAGYTASTDVAVLSAKENQLPPATVAGIELFRQLSAVSPANLSRLVKDQRAFEFYDAIDAAMSLPEIGSPDSAKDPAAARERLGQAIITARRATFDSPVIKAKNAEIEKSVDGLLSRGWFRANAGNAGEMATQLERQARIYVAMGKTPADATERAAKNLKANRIDINGWYVNIAGVPLNEQQKADLPGVANEIIDRYIKAHPNSGLGKDDLTLRNDRRTGLWMLVGKDTGVTPPDPKGPEWVYFSDRNLQAVKEQMRQEEDKGIISNQLAMMAKFEPETQSFLGFTRQTGKLKGMVSALEDKLTMNENRAEVDQITKKLGVLIPLRDQVIKLDDQIARAEDEAQIKQLKSQRRGLFEQAAAAFPKD